MLTLCVHMPWFLAQGRASYPTLGTFSGQHFNTAYKSDNVSVTRDMPNLCIGYGSSTQRTNHELKHAEANLQMNLENFRPLLLLGRLVQNVCTLVHVSGFIAW
jgi:hypothetical protein